MKQARNALNDTGSIDPIENMFVSMAFMANDSMKRKHRLRRYDRRLCHQREAKRGADHLDERVDSHLTLKFLHDIQEDIVDIGAVMELDLDGIEVTERVCDIELTVSTTIHALHSGWRCCLHVILFLCSGRL